MAYDIRKQIWRVMSAEFDHSLLDMTDWLKNLKPGSGSFHVDNSYIILEEKDVPGIRNEEANFGTVAKAIRMPCGSVFAPIHEDAAPVASRKGKSNDTNPNIVTCKAKNDSCQAKACKNRKKKTKEYGVANFA